MGLFFYGLKVMNLDQQLKLFNCRGSRVFRESPQVLAPASIHENSSKPNRTSCQDSFSMISTVQVFDVCVNNQQSLGCFISFSMTKT